MLGPGCPRCDRLVQQVLEVLAEIDLRADFEHVQDLGEISKYGPLPTPALLINGKVVASGNIPSHRHLTEFLQKWGRS